MVHSDTPTSRTKAYCPQTRRECLLGMRQTHAYKISWRKTMCYAPSWKHSHDAHAHDTLATILDVFFLCVILNLSASPTNNSPAVTPIASSYPHRTRHASSAVIISWSVDCSSSIDSWWEEMSFLFIFTPFPSCRKPCRISIFRRDFISSRAASYSVCNLH